MSLTPIDTPGPIGPSEPVNFTLTGEPRVVAIRYYPDAGAGAWDVVFGGTDEDGANGEFSDRYAASERAGDTWTIYPPQGVWPCRFRVYVDEQPDVSAWDTLGDFDFTSLPSTTLNTAQADWTESLGGLTWNVAASIGGGQHNVNGSGYRLYSNGRYWYGGSTQTGSHLSLRLSTLPGYDVTRKQAILGLVNFTPSHVAHRFAVGHYKPNNVAASSGSQCITSSSQIAASARYVSGGALRAQLSAQVALEPGPPDDYFAALGALSGYVFGAVRTAAYGHAVFAPYAGGALPMPEAMKVIGGVETDYAGGDLYGGVGFGCNGSAQELFVKRLVFLQSKAA